MEPVVDIIPSFDTITGFDIISWFFKAFAILFSIIYLLYAVIVHRQTNVMNKTVTRKSGPILSLISFMQIIFGLILLALSIVLI